MSHTDYKRFHNFLMTHGCKVDYRQFRQGNNEPARAPRILLPPLRSEPPGAPESTTGAESADSQDVNR